MQQQMTESFKNPFDGTEGDENDIMITLEPNNTTYTSTQPLPSSSDIKTQSSSSMFDPIIDHVDDTEHETAPQNEEDPPLLEDIGLDIPSMKEKVMAVLTLQPVSDQMVQSSDLAGPVCIAICLGFMLLLGGKLHFSDIESSFVLGSLGLYLLFNFMARNEGVSLYTIMSFLGYSLIPMLVLALFGIFLSLTTPFGVLLSLLLAGWSATSSGNLIATVTMQPSWWLVAYPLFLFYLSFALIIIF